MRPHVEELVVPGCETCTRAAHQVLTKETELRNAARYRARANHPGSIARSTQQLTAARISLDQQRNYLLQHLEGDHR